MLSATAEALQFLRRNEYPTFVLITAILPSSDELSELDNCGSTASIWMNSARLWMRRSSKFPCHTSMTAKRIKESKRDTHPPCGALMAAEDR
ncbi:hypothetical protein H5410_063479 [Solanum commersonii]|uniref:Uncharacterized protein n=1 Tax=Solanum commersonii TaxID=4109 RepID=A0A9J5WDD6_SOLCO|nr:hypothetical protein H5410_063479 [Solanum commersonii]